MFLRGLRVGHPCFNAYRMLLKSGILNLPSERTLRRITHKLGPLSQNTSIKYLNARKSALGASEANVNVILDEIYIASRIEYSSAFGKLCLCSVCGKFQNV